MAKHSHIVLSPDYEELLGLALPSEGGEGNLTLDSSRENVLLAGAYNGINKDFYLPGSDFAIVDPPRKTVRVYHNGRRLLPEEYEILESVPGAGYDLIRIVRFTPNSSSRLYADYTIA